MGPRPSGFSGPSTALVALLRLTNQVSLPTAGSNDTFTDVHDGWHLSEPSMVIWALSIESFTPGSFSL